MVACAAAGPQVSVVGSLSRTSSFSAPATAPERADGSAVGNVPAYTRVRYARSTTGPLSAASSYMATKAVTSQHMVCACMEMRRRQPRAQSVQRSMHVRAWS